MNLHDVTPGIMTRNEEYFVAYVLRDMLQVFPKVMLLDTGSTDRTVEIAKIIASESPGELLLVEEHYGNDMHKIGNGRNVLREMCPTHWFFICDGDEIWRKDKLHNLLRQEVNDGIDVVMLAGWNVQDVDGKLQLRTNDLANRDGLFSPDIRWNATAYPFEGYGLDNYIAAGKVQYFPARECYAWHMRHTLRSSKNWETFFRKDKINFYPYAGPFEDMPEDWLGPIDTRFANPYLW